MKNKLILVTLLLFAAVLHSSTSQAQAIVITEHEVFFIDTNDNEFPSIQAKSIVSPNGNVTITASFKLPAGHELIPEKETKIIGVNLYREDIGVTLWCILNIPPSGRFTIHYHLNGAGNFFPAAFR
ncbi:MAG TPA: hypothetical protein DCY35_05645 [Prolixibacteraceae bacterium]|nr:hypothetical protein [Prolixibacteraceae bacterium]